MNELRWPPVLVWTARAMFLAAVFAALSSAQRLASMDRATELTFTTFYSLSKTTLTTVSAVLGLARRKRWFVVTTAASQLLTAFGSAFFIAEILFEPFKLIRAVPDLLFSNVAVLTFAIAVLLVTVPRLQVEPEEGADREGQSPLEPR